MIMYQLKPVKGYIYYRNNQLDGMKTDRQISDNNNNWNKKLYYQIQIVVLFDLNNGKVIEITLLLLLSDIWRYL